MRGAFLCVVIPVSKKLCPLLHHFIQGLPHSRDAAVDRQVTVLKTILDWQRAERDVLKQALVTIKHEDGVVFQSLKLVGGSLLQEPALSITQAEQSSRTLQPRVNKLKLFLFIVLCTIASVLTRKQTSTT